MLLHFAPFSLKKGFIVFMKMFHGFKLDFGVNIIAFAFFLFMFV